MRSNLASLRLLAAFLLFNGLCLPAVFAQARPAISVQHTTLHSFGGPDGDGPLYGVIADKSGISTGPRSSGAILAREACSS
jgi:hypothetical protein